MRRSRTVLLAVAIAVALAGCGNESTPAPAPPPAGPSTFKVMTQNLYLGADLDPAFAPSANLPQVVDQIWSNVQATDFNARAKVIADTIESADPDLVGLQEVTLWRTQTPGDHSLIPNATTVVYDFLAILQGELTARGLSYRVVATIQNGDVELPGTTGTDYRLTDHDVILAKPSLPVTSTSSGTYSHLATITLSLPGSAPISAPLPRGWVRADIRAGGRTIRYVNTHLEAFSEEIAAEQALELVSSIAKPSDQPTIVGGDMNLPPGSAGYDEFVTGATTTGTGLHDAWSALNPSDIGLTCCWNPDLRGGAFDKRIDLVFATDQVHPTAATKVDETERTPGGLSPSDHAGVVVTFAPEPVGSTAAALAVHR